MFIGVIVGIADVTPIFSFIPSSLHLSTISPLLPSVCDSERRAASNDGLLRFLPMYRTICFVLTVKGPSFVFHLAIQGYACLTTAHRIRQKPQLPDE